MQPQPQIYWTYYVSVDVLVLDIWLSHFKRGYKLPLRRRDYGHMPMRDKWKTSRMKAARHLGMAHIRTYIYLYSFPCSWRLALSSPLALEHMEDFATVALSCCHMCHAYNIIYEHLHGPQMLCGHLLARGSWHSQADLCVSPTLLLQYPRMEIFCNVCANIPSHRHI